MCPAKGHNAHILFLRLFRNDIEINISHDEHIVDK